MDNNYISKLQKLAEKISKAGSIISKDRISKDYIIGEGYTNSIIVRSDSGYEAIYIGNIDGNNIDGYMCLYTNNTHKRNSFPNKNTIAEFLEKVLKKEKLEIGEGKAAYFDWKEFGGIEKQLNYFSEIIRKLAGINE